MNKNLTEKIYNDMTTLLKEKNLIKSIPSLTIIDSFKEVDCKAYIVTHEANGIEKYDIYVNDASYDDIVKNLKTNKEKSINDLFSLVPLMIIPPLKLLILLFSITQSLLSTHSIA